MAIRGELSTDSGDFQYQVVQYWTDQRSEPYVRGADWDKLDSSHIDRVTVYVSREGNPEGGIYLNIWGPYINLDLLESELEAYIEDGEYGEAIG